MEGDYAARLALALRRAWREARQPKELANEVEFIYEGRDRETIRLQLNRWSKYGKDRIYANQGRVKIAYLDLQTGDWKDDRWNSNPELNRAAYEAVRKAASEAGLI